MTTNRDSELNKRYGHLFDWIDNSQGEYKTQKEIEKETKSRYGNLLDGVEADTTLYDNMIELELSCRRERWRREEANRQADIRMRERIEREKREEKERNDKKNDFVNSLMEKDAAEKRARREAEEKTCLENEKRQNVINSIRRMNDITDKITQAREMRERDEQRRKEIEQQIEWYRKQQRK